MSSPRTNDVTIGRLVSDIGGDLSLVLKRLIDLAKSELKLTVTIGGTGAAAFAVAAFLALLLIILVTITGAFFLTMTGMHPAWAMLIVCGVYLLAIGGLVFFGVRQIKRTPKPEKTIAAAKAIPASLKGDHVTAPALDR